jgi:HlyD family secretion protein
VQYKKALAYVLLAVAVLAVVAVGGWALLGGVDRVDVTTATVTDGPVTRQILTTGTLQATTTVEVSAEVNGTVQSLGADYNSIVKKGQVLAQLDPSSARSSGWRRPRSLRRKRTSMDSRQPPVRQTSSSNASRDCRPRKS